MKALKITCAIAVALAGAAVVSRPALAQAAPDLVPLPEARANAAMAELGKFLFFDERMSGDAALSCATCHDPKKGWTDGQPLGRAYPASEYFRNTPTVLNATLKARYHWDGRLDGGDAGTLVRDQMTESVFMNMDARLAQERVKQVPEYVALWKKFRNDDPNGMRIFNVIGEYLKTLTSKNVPFDRWKKGEAAAMNAQQVAGYEIFKGKGGCVACHRTRPARCGKLHRTGVPANPAITAEPLRHITMLRHYSTSGMPNYMNTHDDVGSYAITKDPRDKGKFLTPSIRELRSTAPYMHNGTFATLEDVIEFYDRGGGVGSELKPIGLSAVEKQALVAFLRDGLSGDPQVVDKPTLPAYQVRAFGKN